jgi:hypothetical protein
VHLRIITQPRDRRRFRNAARRGAASPGPGLPASANYAKVDRPYPPFD